MHDRTPANPSPFFLSMLHGLTWIYGTICSVFSCPELQGVELSNIEPFEHVVTSWRNCEWVVQPFPVNLFDEFVCGLNNMLEDVWPSTHMFVLFASRNEHIFLGFFIIYLYIYKLFAFSFGSHWSVWNAEVNGECIWVKFGDGFTTGFLYKTGHVLTIWLN